MITATEAGITTEQHTALETLIEGAAFEVLLYQWLPNLVTATTGVTGYNMFDAVNFNDSVTRITPYKLYSNGENQSGFLSPFNLVVGCPPSLIVDTDLYIFFATDTGISLATFDGSSFSAWDEIVTDSDIRYIAATASDTIHYITFESGNNFRFHVAKYSGSWSVTDSDIYWGYAISSFAAQRVDGIDILTITSDAPGIIQTTYSGSQIIKKVLPSGGIFGFTYKYGTWSDHFEIDQVDQWSAFRYRSRLMMSTIGEKLWLAAYSSEGTIDNPIIGYRIYSTKDGIHWSRGELLSLESITTEGIKLIAVDDMLYAVAYQQIYSAKRTLWFESPHADTILDITPRVREINVSRSDLQQASVTIDDQDDWSLTTIANGLETLAMEVKTGFISGTGNILIDQGFFEVDTIEVVKDIPQKYKTITGRDRLAWLTTRTQSEMFRNWMPQSIGADEYIDPTNSGTDYGGMGHTAGVKGSWVSRAGSLLIGSSNEDAVAYTTFLYDNWNGSFEHKFKLSLLANSEYAGIIFRSPDKDNGFLYIYNQSNDKLYLKIREVGVDTTLYSSSAMGWTSPTNFYKLKIDFRYSVIDLYYSTDNTEQDTTWVFLTEFIVEGQEPGVGDSLTPLMQSGYCGSIGKGFSDIGDIIDSNPIDIGDIPYPPYIPPIGILPDPNTIPPISGTLPTEVLSFSAYEAKATRWTNIGGTPVAHNVSDGLTSPAYIYWSNNFSYDAGFCIDNEDLKYAAHLGNGFTTWVQRRTLVEILGNNIVYCGKGSHMVNGWHMVCAEGARAVTFDGWATFTTIAGNTYQTFALAPQDPNVIYAACHTGDIIQIDKSTDGGLTFTPWSWIPWGHVFFTLLTLEIPYQRPAAYGGGDNPDDSDLVMNLGVLGSYGGNQPRYIFRSHDQGVNFPEDVNTLLQNYEPGRYDYSLTSQTWFPDQMAWPSDQGLGAKGVQVTMDSGATSTNDELVFDRFSQSGVTSMTRGWSAVGDGGPTSGCWITSGFGNEGVGGTAVSFDNGATWIYLDDPSWAVPGSYYAEFRLATVQ